MKAIFYFIAFLYSLNLLNAEEKDYPIFSKKETPLICGALDKATKENKTILIIFSGITWCYPCQQLKKNVLSTSKFIKFAKEKIVLAEYDYPTTKSPKVENNKVQIFYNVHAYPTLLQTDEKGNPYNFFYYNQTQKTDDIIIFIEEGIKRKQMKLDFLATSDPDLKLKIAKEYLSKREGGDFSLFFSDLILLGILKDQSMKIEERITLLGEYYLHSYDKEFDQKIEAELKIVDPEKKWGSARLLAIKEFGALMYSINTDKAYELYLKNKELFKGRDTDYIWTFALNLKERGKLDKCIEVLSYLLEDQDIKKNKDGFDAITKMLKEIKAKSKSSNRR